MPNYIFGAGEGPNSNTWQVFPPFCNLRLWLPILTGCMTVRGPPATPSIMAKRHKSHICFRAQPVWDAWLRFLQPYIATIPHLATPGQFRLLWCWHMTWNHKTSPKMQVMHLHKGTSCHAPEVAADTPKLRAQATTRLSSRAW